MNSTLETLRQFFAWWAGELRRMIPPRLAKLMAPRADRLVIDLDGNGIVISRERNGIRREMARTAAAGAGPRGLENLLKTTAGAGDDASLLTVLRLPASLVLRKRLPLPLAARDDVREVLALDMDRQTPFETEQVYFDASIARIDRTAGRMDVDLVVAPAPVVDDALARLGRFGVDADQVDVNWGDGAGPSVDLLAGRRRPAATPRAHRAAAVLAVLVVVLAVVRVGAGWVALMREEQAVTAAATAARAEAEEARRTQERIDALARQRQFLARQRAAGPTAVATLDELTRVLPDDTYLTRFTIAGDQVQAVGYSTNASALIEKIEASPRFDGTQFLAALVREPRRAEERFHVGFRALPEGTP